MKKTPLYSEHVKLGARMVEFGGWEMPVFYTSVIDEHLTARFKTALFDICHMGEIKVSGNDAFPFLQRMLSNDLSKIENRGMQYNVMCNHEGGIIEDLMAYRLTPTDFLLVVNASNIEKVFNWLKSSSAEFSVDITDMSGSTAKLDIQGPEAASVVEDLTRAHMSEIKRFSYREFIINGVNTMISRSGYTGEDGFEIYFNSSNPGVAVDMWRLILAKGSRYGIKPAGLGARDSLRIEAGYSLYSHEINESINPIEAGIGFCVDLKKNFIGRDALLALKDKVTRKIVAFEMIGKGIPREKYPIQKGGDLLGFVTSGTMSPLMKKGIGMGFVKAEQAAEGNEIDIDIRGKLYKSRIVKRPIYTYKGGK